MHDQNDEGRALLDAYAHSTTPSPAEVEHALTRTLARLESEERSARLPDRRRRVVWVTAASFAALVLATAAIAGVRWVRARAQASTDAYGAAQFDRIDDRIDERLDARAQPRALDREHEPSVEPLPPSASPAPAPESEPDDADPTPEPAPRRRARPKPPASNPADAPVSADASVLAEESRLLARARRALGEDDFEGALDWTDEHARRHPDGALSEERLILEAVAACRGDLRERGLAAAKQLREQFPNTASLTKVDQACAE